MARRPRPRSERPLRANRPPPWHRLARDFAEAIRLHRGGVGSPIESCKSCRRLLDRFDELEARR